MFHPQHPEVTVSTAVFLRQMAAGTLTSGEAIEETFESNVNVTMGKMLGLLRSYIADDTELAENLWRALKVRNRHAHHCFTEHAVPFDSFTGGELMFADSLAAQHQFSQLSDRLDLVRKRYEKANGFPLEMSARAFLEVSSQLRSENLAEYDVPNGPLDLSPMEVGGTDEHLVWVRPECGLTRLV